METKEIFITAETTAEERAEAISLLASIGSEILHFDSITPMTLRDGEESQTLRTFSIMGATVTVTEDQYVDFVDEYLKAREEVLTERVAIAEADGKICTDAQMKMWEEAGNEWPLKD